MALTNRRLAPEIEIVNFIAAEEHLHISSSTIREVASLGGDVSYMTPPHVCRGAAPEVQGHASKRSNLLVCHEYQRLTSSHKGMMAWIFST